MSWCTIESDPGVFTELVKKFGVENIQFEELISLDDSSLEALGQVYGIIFLFRFRQKDYEADDRQANTSSDSSVYFAKQTVQNACATQAIVNILLNSRDKIQIGSMLSDFRGFTSSLPPDMRGESIGQHAEIRKHHNSFARAEPFVMESVKAKDDDDVFHFIGYMPINGKVHELDGLQPGPICLGSCGDGPMDWVRVARTEIQRRMSKFKDGEIHFNLMAIIRDRSTQATEEMATLEAKAKEIRDSAGDGPQTATEEELAVIGSRVQELKDVIEKEAAKKARWSKENKRRKHNYIPFIMALLRKLAKEKKLDGLKAEGKAFVEEMIKQKQKEKEKQSNATK